jgi:osomolarity two-component system response regulator SKN7
MSSNDLPVAQGGGNNASEFVRKLFRMLEDPSHQDVARWGKEGDSFVVVEGEKFTRSILPKHFKHSNMSSFIRQLNKYDFHKVKPSSDSDNASPLGNVLEFKHPYFRIDSKDDLDNIRRKAPAPRKPQATEDFTTSHHISVMSEQLAATQQQVQQLQELYTEVSQTNKVLINEVLTMQKILNAQKQAQHEMLNFLTPYGEGSNSSNMMGHSMNTNGRVSDGDDAAAELRRARELLSSVSTDSVQDRELERLQNVYGSPADSSTIITPTSMPLMHDPMNDITRFPVYPVGQTIGIDPFHSDHIHKIPYAIPNDINANVLGEPQQQPQPQQIPQPPSAEKTESLWGSRKPSVFLVEDDPICAKIGIKFLKSMGCEVEHAPNGAEAYTRITSGSKQFDMIFMDIIMPRLDGVSATMYIRQSHPAIPIIAMTSNIRPEEVNGYFDHGMSIVSWNTGETECPLDP